MHARCKKRIVSLLFYVYASVIYNYEPLRIAGTLSFRPESYTTAGTISWLNTTSFPGLPNFMNRRVHESAIVGVM